MFTTSGSGPGPGDRASKKRKSRLDRLVYERGLAPSREKARALIMAARVLVDGRVVDKPGTLVDAHCDIAVKEALPYVSRGGVKLQGALDGFGIDVKGLTVLDVGSSTGGFTDCLLKRGAKRVHAVDVGRNLIDYRLREDPRVRLIEGCNIRYLRHEEVGETVDLAVIDVSFISLEKVLPVAAGFVKKGGIILALVKPQFEVGRGRVGKGGVVRDPELHNEVIERLKRFSEAVGLEPLGVMESPIKGAKGNREFWLFLRVF